MATIWPCPEAIDCPCADANPLGNFSSENPDPFTHFARVFFPNPIDLNDPTQVFIATSCGKACVSTESQEDANACALRMAVLCVQPPPPSAPNDPVLFGNRAISCQAECPEGPPFVLSVPAGTYLARTQELADLIAQSFCQDDVLQFRQCEMPGPPPTPGAPCPHITSQTASPINANDGDNVTMTVNYTYASAMMLMFVWFKDGVATYATPTSTLTLNAVGPSDAAQYILGIYASGCFPVFSSPITLNVTSACPPEVGPDAPTTLDIIHTTSWETWTIDNPDLSPLVSANPFCNPTGLQKATPSNGLDHPPGIWGWKYVTGSFGSLDPGFCGVATPYSASTGIYQLVDQEFNYDSPIVCNLQCLANACRGLPGDPPPVGSFGTGLAVCGSTIGDTIAQLTAFWAGKAFCGDPYPPDNSFDFAHTNTGGPFQLYVADGSFGDTFLAPLQIQCIQLTGGIPQPRKLQIDNFGVVAADFTDPAIGANWSGDIPTRTTYTSAAVVWNAAASGGFGGATLEWFNTHPTSANGFGWRLRIYGAGPTLVWEGIKGIDTDSLGMYYKTAATPVGPACMNCSDASVTQWFP